MSEEPTEKADRQIVRGLKAHWKVVLVAAGIVALAASSLLTWLSLNRANNEIEELKTAVAAMETDLNSLDRSVRGNSRDLDAMDQRATDLEGGVADLFEWATDHIDRFSSLSQKANRLEDDLTDLGWRVDDNEFQIGELAHCLYREIVGRYFTYWYVGDRVTSCD